MFCMHCGNEMEETDRFCTRCGKSVDSDFNDNNNINYNQIENNNILNLVNNSISVIRNMPGYYCTKCGSYINRNRASTYGDIGCPSCGAQIISPDYFSHYFNSFVNNGFVGGLLYSNAVMSKTSGNPTNEITNYYRSSYYHQYNYPFEYIINDKGRVGEYLVSKQLEYVKQTFYNLNFYTYYGVFIPEPNGSFQEIDCLFIVGKLIFVIEAKNREGLFTFRRLDSETWEQHINYSTISCYSPVLQNEEHISALKEYVSDLSDNYYYINNIALSDSASFKIQDSDDPFADFVLSQWYLCNTSLLTKSLCEMINKYLCLSNANELFDDSYAQKFIKKIYSQINLSENEKKLYMRDREYNSSKHRKSKYEYFYTENQYDSGIILRTNLVYIQEYSYYSRNWQSAKNFKLDANYTLSWNEQVSSFSNNIIHLAGPIEIARAQECILSCSHYGAFSSNKKDYNNNNNNYNKSNSDNSSQSNDSDLMYFRGCSDLDQLNARYKKLCKVFHPDGASGDTESFQMMQNEYELLYKKLA